MSIHLWEINHDGYGPDGCYYANSYQNAEWNRRYDSWAEFADPDGDSLYGIGSDSGFTMGLNCLYRWDWHHWSEDDVDEGDPLNVLELFWMFPRKGAMAKTSITVTDDDEPAVREWLQRFADYMRDMWAPFDLSPAEAAK